MRRKAASFFAVSFLLFVSFFGYAFLGGFFFGVAYFKKGKTAHCGKFRIELQSLAAKNPLESSDINLLSM
jgi:hypothetical protein